MIKIEKEQQNYSIKFIRNFFGISIERFLKYQDNKYKD